MKKEDYMKLSKERLAELLEERDMITINTPYIYSPIVDNSPKCYEPNGTCINPQMDCINCPRHRTTGGNWSTSTNVINKEYVVKQSTSTNEP